MNQSDCVQDQPARLLLDLGQDRLATEDVEALEVWLRAEGLTAPPAWVRQRAERIAYDRPRSSWPAIARRLVAALVFDSRAQPQFVGLRAAQTHIRRLLFPAHNIDVNLAVSLS